MYDYMDPTEFSTDLEGCDGVIIKQLIANGDIILESIENDNHYLTEQGAANLRELIDNKQVEFWNPDPKVIDEIVAELRKRPDELVFTIGEKDYFPRDIERELGAESEVGRKFYAKYLRVQEMLASHK